MKWRNLKERDKFRSNERGTSPRRFNRLCFLKQGFAEGQGAAVSNRRQRDVISGRLRYEKLRLLLTVRIKSPGLGDAQILKQWYSDKPISIIN